MVEWEECQQIVSKLLKGKITPGSGNGRVKGDVITDHYCIEVKNTSKKSYPLSKLTLNKLIHEAKSHRKIPLFVIFFELRSYCYMYSPYMSIDEDYVPTLKEDNLSLIHISEPTRPY